MRYNMDGYGCVGRHSGLDPESRWGDLICQNQDSQDLEDLQDCDDAVDVCPTLWIPAFAGMTGASPCPVDTGSS